MGSGADGLPPDADRDDSSDGVASDDRFEEPDPGWPGPVEEPPPLFES